MRVALATVVAGMALAALPAVANAAASWQEGPLVESQNVDCITGDVTQEAGAYLGYYADPASPPKVGDVYYISVDLAGIGDPCPGIYAAVNLQLPPGTTPAIDASHPVKCFMNLGKGWGSVAQYCPQNLPFGPYGYEVNPINVNPPFWPLAAGTFVEIQIPVVSTQPLAGTASQQLKGYIQLADGQDNPVLTPNLSIVIDPASATNTAASGSNEPIGVLYGDTTHPGSSITSNQQQPDTSTTVGILGYVDNWSNPGKVVAQAAYADSAGDCQSPGQIVDVIPAPTQTNPNPVTALAYPNTKVTGAFTGLFADVAYCWRLVATITGSGPEAGTYYGNWQYFVTNGTYHPYLNEPPAASPPSATTGCSTNGSGCKTSPCTTETQCTTAFSPGQTLNVALAGAGSGSVSDGRFITCPSTCSAAYANGAKVTLTAKPGSGSTFAGWSGGGCSGTGACTVAMNAAQSVTATFNAVTTGGTGGGGAGGGGGTGGSTGAVLRSIAALVHQTLSSALARGVLFNVSCAAACQVTIHLYLDAATASRLHLAVDARAHRKKKVPVLVGSATVSLSAAGSKKATVRLTGRAAHALSRVRSVKLTANAVAYGNGSTSSRTFTVALKR